MIYDSFDENNYNNSAMRYTPRGLSNSKKYPILDENMSKQVQDNYVVYPKIVVTPPPGENNYRKQFKADHSPDIKNINLSDIPST